jgi:hypothetical protein
LGIFGVVEYVEIRRRIMRTCMMQVILQSPAARVSRYKDALFASDAMTEKVNAGPR